MNKILLLLLCTFGSVMAQAQGSTKKVYVIPETTEGPQVIFNNNESMRVNNKTYRYVGDTFSSFESQMMSNQFYLGARTYASGSRTGIEILWDVRGSSEISSLDVFGVQALASRTYHYRNDGSYAGTGFPSSIVGSSHRLTPARTGIGLSRENTSYPITFFYTKSDGTKHNIRTPIRTHF